MALNICPTFPGYNHPCLMNCNSIVLGKIWSGFPVVIQLPKFIDFCLGKFRPSRLVLVGRPVSCNRVSYVLRLCSCIEMIWSNARRIIARVANIKAVRDWATVQNERDSMRHSKVPFLSWYIEPSVSLFVSAPSPNPAILSNHDFAPKVRNRSLAESLGCKIFFGDEFIHSGVMT